MSGRRRNRKGGGGSDVKNLGFDSESRDTRESPAGGESYRRSQILLEGPGKQTKRHLHRNKRQPGPMGEKW